MTSLLVASATADVLDAVRGYLWIVLAAFVGWRLLPVIRERLKDDDVTIEMGGQKLGLKKASTQLAEGLNDLRNQVIDLAERLDGVKNAVPDAAGAEPEVLVARRARIRILWVDDRPEDNAFLIESLTDRAVDVVQAASTDQALALLRPDRRGFDVVIGVDRNERAGPRGVDLVRRMQAEKLTVPVVVYAPRGPVAQRDEPALDSGAIATTASPTELLALLRIGPTTAFEAKVADIVQTQFGAMPFPIRRTVDFVAEHNSERIGIEIKNWSRDPTRPAFERALGHVVAAAERAHFDRILMVTQQGIHVPPGVEIPRSVTVLPSDELVAWFQTYT